MTSNGLSEAPASTVSSPPGRNLRDGLRTLPWFGVSLAAAGVAVAAPLWMTRYVPAVDVPEHLFLIRVLDELSASGSPYASVYVARPGFTYLAVYYPVLGLGRLVGIELAMRLFLSLVLAAFPLSLWALLRALGREKWLALLAVPLAYTDNFYWGYVSFHASIPVTLLALAAFVRVLEEREPAGLLWPVALGTSLLGVQLVHGAAMVVPGLALPTLLGLTPSDRRRRTRALIACAPAAIVFGLWLAVGLSSGRRIGAPGEPWTSGPGGLFALSNYSFRPVADAVNTAFDLLSSGFWGYADRPVVIAAGAAATVCAIAGVFRPQALVRTAFRVRARPAALFAIAAALYLFLPVDVAGYMYAVAPRYAQVAVLLLVPAIPFPGGPARRLGAAAAAACALFAPAVLAPRFAAFGAEAAAIEPIVAAVQPASRIMHLIVDPGSREASHPAFLHFTAYVAFRTGSIPSFSLAIDPSYPVGYAPGGRPPASPWEWQPLQVDFESAGPFYDYFLWRGPGDARAHLGRFGARLEPAASSDGWILYRRRGAAR